MKIPVLSFDKASRKKPSMFIFVLLIALYIVFNVLTPIIANSEGVLQFGEQRIPLAGMAGVVSSVSYMSIVFMVIFYGKIGFYTAMFFYSIMFVRMFVEYFIKHDFSSLPGFFTSMVTFVSIIVIFLRNRKIAEYRKAEKEYYNEQQKYSQRLFKQTATALVSAIDAKDTYSHGHSVRVAEYSRMIAEAIGKSEDECEKIYFAALLHDVGKIGIPESIINKKGKLTDEEFGTIKQHPVMGNQILSSISEYPYLSIGAFFHHERYDGKGYPTRLKGEDIPEIARIISVADAYDAMTSNRSYRDAIPQQIVREEIVKGAGTQFDPELARVMQNLIDLDQDYKMKERDIEDEISGKNEIICEKYRDIVSDGIIITPYPTRVLFRFEPLAKISGKTQAPAFIVFDSLDGRVHDDEKTIRDMNYFEYCEIHSNGRVENKGVREIKEEYTGSSGKKEPDSEGKTQKSTIYELEAVKWKDHVLIKINDGSTKKEITVALPDSSRFVYIGLTGEQCVINGVRVEKSDKMIGPDHINRIAEEISYINCPAGDIPNVQVDGNRTDATLGIPVTDGLKISFHTMSLPTARLISHCPYISLFYSDDKKVWGSGYREYAFLRLDGENMESNEAVENKLTVSRNGAFTGWDAWKKVNREGMDVSVTYSREGNVITVTTENFGILIKDTIVIPEGPKHVYTALTGDQCAITNIRITNAG